MSNSPNEPPHRTREVRGIPRRTGSGPAPLSFGQQRLWFLSQLRPNDSAYNMIQVLRLTGPLDVPALERAFNEIRRRHDVLRANVDLVGDQPVQFVAAYGPVPFTIVDCSTYPEDQRESACQEVIASYSRPPFNLKSDPLLRTALVRLGPTEHRLVLVMHHIIYDGWSTRLLLQECVALYEAFAQGKPSPLPDLPIQYSDYARWQREWLTGAVLDKHLSYWRERLRGSVSPIELPADRPRRGGETSAAARVGKVLPVELLQSLKSLGQRHNATLFMTLLAAFQTLLCRVSGQDDVVLGSPIAGRTQLETERLLGFFINTLPIRIDMSGRPTFAELLDRVRLVVLDAIKHQELPFEKLVEELQPERSLNHSPLVQVMLNAFLLDVPQLHAQGLTFESVSLSAEESKFDLTMLVQKAGQTIRVDLKYNADLFDAVRMEHMLDQFVRLLQQIVAEPDKRIASYSLLTEASRHILPDPTVAFSEPRFEPVTDGVLSQVRQAPGQTAVIQAGHSWSYSELWSAAEAIARALLARQLRRGDAVGLMGPRSFGFVAALVGIFRSGGVLLTVDRTLPVNRQRLILTEARAKHLVYVGERRHEEEWLHGTPGLEIISVAKDGSVENPSADISVPDITPEDAAYIFFTSGTTGIPKGVLGCHKSLGQFMAWQRTTFDVRPDDRCAQLTSPTFEVILRDVFLPFVSGATLCLPDETADTASGDMLSWMDREGITIFHAVPTVGQAWLGAMANGARPRKLRWAFFGGEPLTDRLVARWRSVIPPTARIVNLYGPAETTLVKTFHLIPEQPTHGVQPLGKPLPYAQALVLNEERELCGVGEPGEIMLRTPFRTLGYINAPAEQQKRFVSNPFRNSPEDLVYLTGDRGRYRPDGVLEFLGRIDDQIKIRGVRIEPAEVDAILGRHPKVAACFVTAVKGANGEDILAAFVVPAVASDALAAELRSYLSEQLPRAMVPSAFVFLDALPVLSNGKVDRRALATLDLTRSDTPVGLVPPRTHTERVLERIWCRVLGREQVGVQQNFFDLGGHSLLATQVVSQIRHELNVELPLDTIFTKPTIDSLAVYLLEQAAVASDSDGIGELLAEVESLSDEGAEGEFRNLEREAGAISADRGSTK
jgi:amino acid adenylation domain-containing protein